MHNKIFKWLERLPDACNSIVLRAGDTRTDEGIIERWTTPLEDLDEICETVNDCMQDEIQGRLIAYSDKGKQLRSLSLRTDARPQQTTDTGMLVEGILRMAEEQRRFVATITDTFATMHETIQDALYAEREHHEEMADAQLAIAMAEMDKAQNQTSTTDKALGMFADILNSRKNIDLKQHIINNPDIVDHLLNDEDIVNLVMSKFQK